MFVPNIFYISAWGRYASAQLEHIASKTVKVRPNRQRELCDKQMIATKNR